MRRERERARPGKERIVQRCQCQWLSRIKCTDKRNMDMSWSVCFYCNTQRRRRERERKKKEASKETGKIVKSTYVILTPVELYFGYVIHVFNHRLTSHLLCCISNHPVTHWVSRLTGCYCVE